jgi:dihydroneopterin aldolase
MVGIPPENKPTWSWLLSDNRVLQADQRGLVKQAAGRRHVDDIAEAGAGRHGSEMADRRSTDLCSTTAEGARYTVTVRGLVLMCSIGIRASERERTQRVRVSVDLVAGNPFPREDRRRIINYEKVVAAIRGIVAAGHIDLCEGLAERISAACLADRRVKWVRVWVEKLDVFPEAEGVGAMLERTRAPG